MDSADKMEELVIKSDEDSDAEEEKQDENEQQQFYNEYNDVDVADSE